MNLFRSAQPEPTRFLKTPFGRFLTRSAVVAAATPFVVAGGIMISDSIQRRRRPLTGKFPITPPAESVVGESTVTVYAYGEDLYADMLAAIRGAKHTVMLETYIWKDDKVGREFKAAIEDAAARGVDVFVVYDGFANLVVPREALTFSESIQVIRFPVFRAGG
ncbi:hypothetical protein GCM10025865_29350 [Paraoerskovia sediminicola]|uniref:Cardiolipin synthase n=1 Tax=Paraoerskovia sediminicola TaxID=1138587 RepID=A0ABN6XJC1_9CELL|nr:hypothetical protein GCM10025865_29350 [Paraoerskovia sediminicola]